MGSIIDISYHNGNIDWSTAHKNIDLAIIRVQYGSNKIDDKYKEYVTACKAYGIPFGHYAYGCYVSVDDAIVEAKDFLSRIDKDAKFLVLDVEDDTVDSMKSTGNLRDLAKASQAFINVCKDAGYKVGLYVSHHLYDSYNLSKIDADFLWIPRYGKRPAYSCDLWQYADGETGGWLDGIGKCDLNYLNGDKSLEWFVGTSNKAKYIVTGGLKEAACNEITNYLLSHNWWARMEFEGDGNGNAFVTTGGFYEPALSNVKAWLDEREWYYEVKDKI